MRTESKDKELIFELIRTLQKMLELTENQGLSQNHSAIIDARDAIEKAILG